MLSRYNIFKIKLKKLIHRQEHLTFRLTNIKIKKAPNHFLVICYLMSEFHRKLIKMVISLYLICISKLCMCNNDKPL